MNTNPQRRRFPRFAGIAAAFLLVAGGALAVAHATGGMRGLHGGMDPQEMAEHVEVHVKHVLAEVDATPEQQAQIQAIVKSTLVDLKGMHDQAGAARTELESVLTADKVDRDRLEALRAAHMKAFDEASRRCTTAIADVADVLTPEQRAQLAQKFEKRREMWRH